MPKKTAPKKRNSKRLILIGLIIIIGAILLTSRLEFKTKEKIDQEATLVSQNLDQLIIQEEVALSGLNQE